MMDKTMVNKCTTPLLQQIFKNNFIMNHNNYEIIFNFSQKDNGLL
jgi:hypothetical protein